MSHNSRKRSRDEFEECNVISRRNRCFKKRRCSVHPQIPIKVLKRCRFNMIRPKRILKNSTFNGVPYSTNAWAKVIAKKYLKNLDCSYLEKFNMVCLRIKLWAKNNVIKQLIPKVPVTQMHVLPPTAQKCMILTCVVGPQEFHQQFSFKTHYDEYYPFLVIFQTHGKDNSRMHRVININNTKIVLRRTSNELDGEDTCSFWMGNDTSVRFYSYLPVFKKLLSTKDGSAKELINIEIDFDWC